MRYNRTFRVFAAVLRNLTEMVANAIGPAIAANFFVYFLGLPHKIQLFGRAVPTFALIVGACILFAMVALWPAGRISLLVTDTVQGMLSYPIFALVAAWIFFHFDWKTTMEPVMVNRVAGESFLNPFDIDKLRDLDLDTLKKLSAGLANLAPAEKLARFAPDAPAGAALANALSALPKGLPLTPQVLLGIASGVLRPQNSIGIQ